MSIYIMDYPRSDVFLRSAAVPARLLGFAADLPKLHRLRPRDVNFQFKSEENFRDERLILFAPPPLLEEDDVYFPCRVSRRLSLFSPLR